MRILVDINLSPDWVSVFDWVGGSLNHWRDVKGIKYRAATQTMKRFATTLGKGPRAAIVGHQVAA